MRRSSLVAVAGCLVLLGGASRANAQETTAAACPGPPLTFVFDENSDARLAQTFVPTLSGSATRAEMSVGDVSGQTGEYTVQLLAADGSGTPTDTVLAQTTAPDAPDGQSTLKAAFPTHATIIAGHTYALALSRPGDYLSWDIRSDSDDCPGRFFYQEGGGPWNGALGADAIFRLFAIPAPTYSTSGTSAVAGTSAASCGGWSPTITGTAGNDDLRGTLGPDVIAGLGGRDKLLGLGGGDVICGGPGRDAVRGGAGNDRLYGQAGRDVLRGGAGHDLLRSGGGRDTRVQ